MTAVVAVEPLAPHAGTHAWPWGRILRVTALAGLAAFVAADAYLLGPYLDKAADSFDDLRAGWVAVAVAAEFVSMTSWARLQQRMLRAGGVRVPLRRMITTTYAAYALNTTLPAGTAVGAGYAFRRMRRYGASAPLAGFAILATNALSLVTFGVLGVWVLMFAGGGGSELVTIAAGVALLFGGLLLARRLAHRPERLVRIAQRGATTLDRLRRRDPRDVRAAVRDTIDAFLHVHPARRDWAAGFGLAAMNWATDLLCLVAACRAVGADGVTPVLAGAAYLIGESASSVSILPGGFGVVDAAMVLALTHGGVNVVHATAAVLLYRAISFVFTMSLGWIAWAGSWQADRHGQSAPHPEVTAHL